MKKVFNCILVLGLVACQKPTKIAEQPVAVTPSIKYAQGFTIKTEGAAKWVTVTYPYQGATAGYQYLLIHKGTEAPPHDANVQVIETPIERIVCTSTTHIPHLDYLGVSNTLVGFPTTDYISSEKVRKRIDEGAVVDLGIDKGMDIELLFAQQPALVMGYTMSGDLGQLKKIQELNVPVVINAEYLERTPLGRAEWIKFTSLFFEKEREADSVFNAIEDNYLTVSRSLTETTERPAVLSGIVYGDTWFMPGGKNYAAQILHDAGCNYLWRDDDSHGFLELSFESVYDKAKEADYWIGAGAFNTFTEMKAAEERYALFQAFKNKQVYTYNARMGAKGGNEFLELGYLRPDIVLRDLVKITHPQMLPEHQLYFYKQLDENQK